VKRKGRTNERGKKWTKAVRRASWNIFCSNDGEEQQKKSFSLRPQGKRTQGTFWFKDRTTRLRASKVRESESPKGQLESGAELTR